MAYSLAGTTILYTVTNTLGHILEGTINAGTPPTTAATFAVGCRITDLSNGVKYTNDGTLAVPTWNAESGAGSVSSAEIVAPSDTGLGVLRTARAKYSFAVDGGAVGAIIPASTAVIPDNAIIVAATINSTTAVVGTTSTLSVGTTAGSSATSILAATAEASLSVDAVLNGVPTFAVPVKMTAAGSINVTVGANVLTAGIVEVTCLYFVAAA